MLSTFAKGEYGLSLVDEQLAELELGALGHVGELGRLLRDIAGRQADPRRGQAALQAALDAGPTSVDAQLREIRELLVVEPQMNVRALSERLLRQMHDGIRDALAAADGAPPARKQQYASSVTGGDGRTGSKPS